MSNIAALLERVRAATGPDRKLDGAIKMAAAAYMIAAGSPQKQVIEAVGGNLFDAPPRFTASVDAALALADRVLEPTTKLEMTMQVRGKYFHVELETADGDDLTAYNCPSLPLAILAALLLALKDQPHD